jgi:hypothetical protein
LVRLRARSTGCTHFLTSLSSSNTEFVYLGSINTDIENETNTRITVLEELRLTEAATYYRKYLFNQQSFWPIYKDILNASEYEELDTDTKSLFLKGAQGDQQLASRSYYSYAARIAVDIAQARIVKNRARDYEIPEGILPPFVAFPKALKEYLLFREKNVSNPPDWVMSDFLVPLGYDKQILKTNQSN